MSGFSTDLPYRLEGDRYSGRFVPAVERCVAERWLGEAHAWFDPRRPLPGAPKKKSVALVETPLGHGVAKRVSRHKPGFVRRLRAARLFDLALRFASAGVPTAAPWAALLPRRSADPTIFLAQHVDLPTLWDWLLAGAPGDRALAAAALADCVANLHAGGLRHRDLKSANLLFDAGPPARFVVLDLDGVRARPSGGAPYPRRKRARDLARILVSLRAAPRPEGAAEVWPALLARYAERLGDAEHALERVALRWAKRHAAKKRASNRPLV